MNDKKKGDITLNYCYADTLERFMIIKKSTWLKQVTDSFKIICGEAPSCSQIKSWDDSFEVLHDQLAIFAQNNPYVYIAFEYVLRFTSKKRPDVLLLSGNKLAILEFKRKGSELIEDRLQVEEYARKLYQYHLETSKMERIFPILVLSSDIDLPMYKSGIAYVVSKKDLGKIVEMQMKDLEQIKDASSWLNSKYAETPTVIEYSLAKKNKVQLPEYEIVRKAGVEDAEKCLKRQIVTAYRERKHIIAFVNGVPGSGKTLLGVDLAYDSYDKENGIHSTFVSGNGPLVAVLQDVLGDTFIKNIHIYLDQFTEDQAPEFNYNVCIFDEGQRTWTAKQRAKKGKRRGNISEAQLFVEMVDTHVDWCFVLVLIGDGQEINTGEENGIELWKQAIDNSRNQWEVLCSTSMEKYFFNNQFVQDDLRGKLTLVNSLRPNGSRIYSEAVNRLIAGETTNLKHQFDKATKLYPIFLTRDIEKAKNLCKHKYEGCAEKKYGLIASSQSIILPKYGVNNRYENTKQTRVYPAKWYNATSDSPFSCCSFNKPVTEFGCQGLELDMPIVCWESDLVWNGKTWDVYAAGKYGKYSVSGYRKEYRLNTYRVLMTRGRDGLVIYVPPEEELDKTYELLYSLGFEEL